MSPFLAPRPRRPAIVLAFLVALLALAAACGGSPQPPAAPTPTETPTPAAQRVEVRIGDLTVQAELALTQEQRSQGLSGRPSLPREGGMLFVFPQEGQPGFWMRGMRFPLDLVWISRDGRVVDLTEDANPVDPALPDDQVPRYRPDQPVLSVLEVNAGVIREAGIQVGDTVTFEPEVPPGQ